MRKTGRKEVTLSYVKHRNLTDGRLFQIIASWQKVPCELSSSNAVSQLTNSALFFEPSANRKLKATPYRASSSEVNQSFSQGAVRHALKLR